MMRFVSLLKIMIFSLFLFSVLSCEDSLIGSSSQMTGNVDNTKLIQFTELFLNNTYKRRNALKGNVIRSVVKQ